MMLRSLLDTSLLIPSARSFSRNMYALSGMYFNDDEGTESSGGGGPTGSSSGPEPGDSDEGEGEGDDAGKKVDTEKRKQVVGKTKKSVKRKVKKGTGKEGIGDRLSSLEEENDMLRNVVIDNAMSGLTDEQRKTADKWRDKMPLKSFLELMKDMFQGGSGASGAGANDKKDEDNESSGDETDGDKYANHPPFASMGKHMKHTKKQGRELTPDFLEFMDNMSGSFDSLEYGRRLLDKPDKERDAFTVPVKRLVAAIKVRSTYGDRIPHSEIDKALDEIMAREKNR